MQPKGGSRSYRGLVEVSLRLGKDLAERLLVAAYRAGDREPVLVLLRDLTAAEADRILDRVVTEEGLHVAGVHYLTAEADGPALVETAARTPVVVVSTPELRDRLFAVGVEVLGPRRGLRALERLRGETAAPGGRDSGSHPTMIPAASA